MRLSGKTLTFYEIRSGGLVGTEQFLNRSVSVWREEGAGLCLRADHNA